MLLKTVGEIKIENDFLKKSTYKSSVRERAVLVDAGYKDLSVAKQCGLPGSIRT